jgi:hypothetical protein
MRRPAPIGPALAALGVIAGTASAGPWRGQIEAGGEIDTNVQRVETGPALDTATAKAPLVRAGGRVERAGRRGANVFALTASGSLRRSLDRGITTEDTALLGVDARWLRALGERPASAGLRAVYADALPLSGVEGTRTFRSLTGEGLLVLRREEGDQITLLAGARSLTYKPDHDFDWVGPTAGVRFDRTLWTSEDDTRTVELDADYRVERRAYDGAAFANRCEPGAEPTPMCFAPTASRRADLYHVASVEATYTGDRVLSAGYQLTYVDSNSYGQSLVRHRVTLSATSELPAGFIGTATITGQLDQYLDTLILARDVQSVSFTALDDDNRSSLQLRAAHPVGDSLSVEGRAAFWTDLSGPDDVKFRRLLLYAGVVWATE